MALKRFMLSALSTQSQWRILRFSFSRFALILCGPRWVSKPDSSLCVLDCSLTQYFLWAEIAGRLLLGEVVWNFVLKGVYFTLFIVNIS